MSRLSKGTSGRFPGSFTVSGMTIEAVAQTVEHGAYDLLQGLPFFVEGDCTRFEPRHVEYVLYDPVQMVGFFTDGLEKIEAADHVDGHVILQECRRRTRDRRQRRAQIM